MLYLNARKQFGHGPEDKAFIERGSEWKILAMESDKTLYIEEAPHGERRLGNIPCEVFGFDPETILLLIKSC
jgi:hypothetical protein